jgi:hypothetical protein
MGKRNNRLSIPSICAQDSPARTTDDRSIFETPNRSMQHRGDREASHWQNEFEALQLGDLHIQKLLAAILDDSHS